MCHLALKTLKQHRNKKKNTLEYIVLRVLLLVVVKAIVMSDSL